MSLSPAQVLENGYPKDTESKQVVMLAGLEPVFEDKEFIAIAGGPPQDAADAPSDASNRIEAVRSRRRIRWIAGSAVILLLLLALLIPVGVVVSRNKKPATTPKGNPGPPANATPPSTKAAPGGVLKGTRLTTMDPRTNGDIFPYYQLYEGSLHYISQSVARLCQGITDLMVNDAKPGTPLCTTSTATNGSVIWWPFYVNQSNIIQSIYSKSDPTLWQKGNIGDQGYKVPHQSNIAFTVSRGQVYNSSASELEGGVSLYSSDEGGTVQEYIYNANDGSWSKGYAFRNIDGLGSASIWTLGVYAYLFTVNTDQAMEMWWRRYDNVTQTHKPDSSTWKLGPSGSGSLASSGGMCGQWEDFAFQGADGEIKGSNYTSWTQPASCSWGLTSDTSNGTAIAGSGPSCWSFAPTKPNTRFHVFYQVEGNDIWEARRYWGPGNATVPGHWTYQPVPIK